ncbi:MAG: hypothetical protein IIB55_02030, partial [Planctomycetes bacterium]|nr:hypothetical protein [Planctomycetota bacterium]
MSYDEEQGLAKSTGDIVAQDAFSEDTNSGNALLASMGGGGGDGPEDDVFEDEYVPSSKRRFSTQTIIIALIAVVGGGLIWGMRWYEMQQGMKMKFNDTAVLPDASARLTLTREQERVLAALQASAEQRQINAVAIDKNPFVMEGAAEPVSAGPTQPVGPDIEALTRDYMRRFEALNMTSVVSTGAVPVAVVSGRVVQVGSILDDIFKVREIAKHETSNRMYVKIELVAYDPAVDGSAH